MLLASKLERNEATDSGGGLYQEGGGVVLTAAWLSLNNAPMGANVMRVGGSFHYALPAVAGRCAM